MGKPEYPVKKTPLVGCSWYTKKSGGGKGGVHEVVRVNKITVRVVDWTNTNTKESDYS